MGELIGIEELKDMVTRAVDERGFEVFASMLASNRPVKPVEQDGVQKWWKHEVEAALQQS